MSFHIAGIGTALPEHAMSQREATNLAQQICCNNPEQSRTLAVLYRKSGVANRYTALPHQMALNWLPAAVAAAGPSVDGDPGEADLAPPMDVLGPTTAERMQFFEDLAPPLAEQSARVALDEAGYRPADITHLISVSCTGFVAPGVDVELIRRLGLPATTERVQVGFMGCHGAINGLRVAQAIAAADPQARILLSAVELCSLHYRFQWDPVRFLGNILFADGAAALVGRGGEPAASNGAAHANGNGASPAPWRVSATGSCLLPDSTDAMTWRIGDHGFEMTLSPRVPDLICAHLRPWLSGWLAGRGLRIEDVGSWAVHPGGPRIVSAVEESLGLAREATQVSRDVLSECGNMSSPTVVFILDRLRRAAAPRPCVALGFGPGLVAEVALLE